MAILSRRWPVEAGLWLFLASTWLAPSALAGEVSLPGHRPIDDFEICDTHAVELDGIELVADIYYSRREVTYYVSAPELGRALLLSPRGESVQAVAAKGLERSRGVGARLAGGEEVEYLGRYDARQPDGAWVFELDGRQVRFVKRSPMVGSYSSVDVGGRHRRYARQAEGHVPRRRAEPASVRRPEELLVRVYFGSWSPACDRIVPKVMRLEQDLKGRVRFEYLGLAPGFTEDPEVREAGVYSLPTAVVLRQGEEVGRAHGRALDTPSEALLTLLTEEPAR